MTNKTIRNLVLRTDDGDSFKLKAKQNDTNSRVLTIDLRDSQGHISVTGTPLLNCKLPDETIVYIAGTTNENGTVTVTLTNSALSQVGTVSCSLTILSEEDEQTIVLTSQSFYIDVVESEYSSEAIEASSNFDAISVQLASVQTLLDAANETLAHVEEIMQDANGLESRIDAIEANEEGWDAKYDKPDDGIPYSDLSADVQSSLDKAETALQAHQDISGKVDKDGNKVLSTNDFTDALKDKLDSIVVENIGKIDEVRVNGVSVVNNKTAEITIPTNVSAFTNDSGYLTQHQDISGKVDKIEGKSLSTNDFTNALKSKLENLDPEQMGRIDDVTVNGVSVVSNKIADITIPTIPSELIDAINNGGFLTEHQDISGKVDKVDGKGLSTNDYTNADKSDVSLLHSSIESGGIGYSSESEPVVIEWDGDTTTRETAGEWYAKISDHSIDSVEDFIGAHLTFWYESAEIQEGIGELFQDYMDENGKMVLSDDLVTVDDSGIFGVISDAIIIFNCPEDNLSMQGCTFSKGIWTAKFDGIPFYVSKIEYTPHGEQINQIDPRYIPSEYRTSADQDAIDSEFVTVSDDEITETSIAFNADTLAGHLPSYFESTSNKTTTISAYSTDAEYPSAKAVYDLMGDVEAALADLR